MNEKINRKDRLREIVSNLVEKLAQSDYAFARRIVNLLANWRVDVEKPTNTSGFVQFDTRPDQISDFIEESIQSNAKYSESHPALESVPLYELVTQSFNMSNEALRKEMVTKLFSQDGISTGDREKVEKEPINDYAAIFRLKAAMRSPSTFTELIRRLKNVDDDNTEQELASLVLGVNYFSNAEILAAHIAASEAQKIELKDRLRNSKHFSPESKFSMLILSNLMVIDEKLGLEYLKAKKIQDQDPDNQELMGSVFFDILPFLLDGKIDAEWLSKPEKEFLAVFAKHQDCPIRLYDAIVQVLKNKTDVLKNSDQFLRQIDDLLSDPLVVSELCKHSSPYIHYIVDAIGFKHALDLLKSRVKQAKTGWLGSMRARVAEIPLEEHIVRLKNEGKITEFDTPVTDERIDSTMEQIYIESAKHTGISKAVKEFMAGKIGTYFFRANSESAAINVVKTGCYAQEFIPYIPMTRNYLPGLLNSLGQVNTEKSRVIQECLTNKSISVYRSDSGDAGVILIMKPSDRTLERTVYSADKHPNTTESTHCLTLVGMPTSEIVGIILPEQGPRDFIAALVNAEKFIPVFDEEGNLVFSEEDFNAAMDVKLYQSVEQCLEKGDIINRQRNRLSGHGPNESLAEHSERVVGKIGQIWKSRPDRITEILKLGATLHDSGKGLEMNQTGANLSEAVDVLPTIRGLSLWEKELILSAIEADEVIGFEILANFDDSTATEQEIMETRERITQMFSTTEQLLFALDIYYADVSGVGVDELSLKTWRVKEKLQKLRLFEEEDILHLTAQDLHASFLEAAKLLPPEEQSKRIFGELIGQLNKKFLQTMHRETVIDYASIRQTIDSTMPVIELSRPEANTVLFFADSENIDDINEFKAKAAEAGAYLEYITLDGGKTIKIYAVFGVDQTQLEPKVMAKVNQKNQIFIEQGCYGVFDPNQGIRRVGTDGMGPCTPLVVQNLQTGKFLFSHIDHADRAGEIVTKELSRLRQLDTDTFLVVSGSSEVLSLVTNQIKNGVTSVKIDSTQSFIWDGNERKELIELISGENEALEDAKRILKYKVDNNVRGGTCVYSD